MRFKAATISKGWSLFKIIRFFLIFSTLISVLVGITITWQETHQIEPILESLGNVFNPIYTFASQSQELLSQGFYPSGRGFFGNFWGFLVNIYSILQPIIIIYLLLFYLFLFSEKLIIMDDSRKLNSLIVTLIIFFGMQFLYIALFTDLSLKTPFTSLLNLVKIIKNIFS